LVRRYSEIENIYLRSEDVIDTQDLQAAIVKLYRRVLEYEARAACQFNRNTAIQMARNVVEADGWDGILTAVKTEDTACKDLTAIIDTKSQRQGKRQLMNLLAEQDLKIDELLKKLHKEDEIHKKLLSERQNWRQKDEERDCLQSFRNSDYERYKSRNPDRVNGTCVWFLKHPNFKDWLGNEKSRLLWVSADPGCGKSVLSKSLIDNELRCTDSRTTCYFFFKDDNPDQKSATKAICALLHQLFSQKPMLLKYAVTEIWKNGQIQRDLFSSLWSILERATTDPEAGEVVCIVDALDECEVSGRLELIESLIRLFDKSPSDQTALKFLVTSRPYVSIERRFKQLTNTFPTVRLAGEAESELISHEIEEVIKAKVQDFGVDLDLAVSVRKSLEKKLLSVPHRTYLWLELIFDLIPKQLQVTEKRLLKMIDTLPDTVSKAYTAILDKSTDLPKARKLLHIVVAARRPLTLRETNVALAVEKDSRSYDDLDLEQEDRFHVTVRNLCGLFVSVVDSKIYLIHQTAKEFLIRDKDMARPAGQGGNDQGDWEHSLEPGESNLVLTNVCVSYLLFDVFESEPIYGEFQMRVLLDKYKRYYKWLETSASELPGTNADDLEGEIGSDPQKYLEAIQKWCNSGFTEYAGRHAFLEYSSMNWAPHFRCANTEDDIILSKSALTLCNPQYLRFPAWFLAYIYEYPVYWDLFHPFGPDVTPLMMVSFLGLEAPMQMLLGEQGTVNTDLRDSTGRTALLWAAIEGHENVVELLLRNGADVNRQDNCGVTALSLAARKSSVERVSMLLKYGASVSVTDNEGMTALHVASANGNKVTVQLLLEKGASISAKDNMGMTTFHSASSSYNMMSDSAEACKQLLQKASASVTVDDGNVHEFLKETVDDEEENHCEAAVRLLLKYGADTEARDNKGRTALELLYQLLEEWELNEI